MMMVAAYGTAVQLAKSDEEARALVTKALRAILEYAKKA
jgi:hypothetical protein